jgi:hypothetical protein
MKHRTLFDTLRLTAVTAVLLATASATTGLHFLQAMYSGHSPFASSSKYEYVWVQSPTMAPRFTG